MEKKKICPFLSAGKDGIQMCREDDCAIWLAGQRKGLKGRCSLTSLNALNFLHQIILKMK